MKTSQPAAEELTPLGVYEEKMPFNAVEKVIFDRLRIPTYDDPRHMKTAELHFDPEKCKQCGVCVSLCPDRSGTAGRSAPTS